MITSHPRKISVIGSGVASVGFINRLAKKCNPKQNLEISIFNGGKTHFASGTPYDFFDCEPEHLINMPQEEMSIENNELKKFIKDNFDLICSHVNYKFEQRLAKEFQKKFNKKFDAGKKEEYLNDANIKNDFLKLIQKYEEKFTAFKARYLEPDKNEFIPRIVYGMYLREKFFSSLKQLINHGVTVNLFPEKVIALRQEFDKTTIVTSDKTNQEADDIVIATGHWDNSPNNTHENVVYNIWPSSFLKKRVDDIVKIKMYEAKNTRLPIANVDICIIGTGLSAIDAVKTIFSDGDFKETKNGIYYQPSSDHDDEQVTLKINVTMLSRTGTMPKVRGKYFPYQNKHLTDDSVNELINQGNGKIHLQDIAKLLIKDMQEAYGNNFDDTYFENMFKEILQRGKNPIKTLKEDYDDIISANDKKLMWQTVYHQASSDDIFIKIKNYLPADESLYFDKFLKTHHMMHLAPMPSKTAEELIALHEADLINVRSIGHKSQLIKDDTNLAIIDSQGQQINSDLIIYATGQENDVAKNNSDLFLDLFVNHKLKAEEFTIRRDIAYINSSNLQGIEQLANLPKTSGTYNFSYPTGGIERTEMLHIPQNNHLYVIGVASGASGTSRASRAMNEGRQVADSILNSMGV